MVDDRFDSTHKNRKFYYHFIGRIFSPLFVLSSRVSGVVILMNVPVVLRFALNPFRFSLIAQCFMAYLKAKETDIIPRGYVDTLDGSFMMDDGAARKVEVERRSRIWAKAFPNRPFVLTDDDGVYRIPFIVKGHCDNFQQYCSRWFTQIGPYFKLVENGVRDGGHLYYFLKIAFNQFQAIMQQPQFDDLLIEVGEEASSGFGSGSENFSEEE